MQYHTIHKGAFLSRRGHTWGVTLERLQDEAPAAVGSLMFPADEPLVIEWEEKQKHEPVQGSTALLRLLSPGDRTYEGLYTIRAAEVRLTVTLDGATYWCGTLDPEFYEEPYAYGSLYVVELSFADFGLLERTPWDVAGRSVTLREAVARCMEACALEALPIDESMVSTRLAADSAATLRLWDFSIEADNFRDEEGEPNTLMEVLEAVLQPLALRIVQRRGKLYVYDLHARHEAADDLPVRWASTDQTLGADVVYNNAIVTFSPYCESSLLPEVDAYGADDAVTGRYNLTGDAPGGESEYYSWYADYDNNRLHWDYEGVEFTLFLSKEGRGAEFIGTGCRYFRFVPALGGGEHQGVAWGFFTGGHGSIASGYPKCKLNYPDATGLLLRTPRVHLPLCTPYAQSHELRLVVELMADARYNPFTQASGHNEQGNYDTMASHRNILTMGCTLQLRDADGNPTWYYDSRTMDYSLSGWPRYLGASLARGTWKAGADPRSDGSCLLTWYPSDRLDSTPATDGFTKNRQNFLPLAGLAEDGSFTKYYWHLYESFTRREAGEYIPFPPEAGYLDLTLWHGLTGYNVLKKDKSGYYLNEAWEPASQRWRELLRWDMVKLPVLEVVNRNIKADKAAMDDVEYRGEVNADAREDLELDTLVGTAANPQPGARGLLRTSADGLPLRTLYRAGRTTQAEQLLIGTLFSQYGRRHVTLSGTCDLLCTPPATYTDASQPPGLRLLCTGDRQNLIAHESEAVFIELSPDEYRDNEE